jgi:hypothetical protein
VGFAIEIASALPSTSISEALIFIPKEWGGE